MASTEFEGLTRKVSELTKKRRQEQLANNEEVENEFDEAKFRSLVNKNISDSIDQMLGDLHIKVSDEVRNDLINSAFMFLSNNVVTNNSLIENLSRGNYGVVTPHINDAVNSAPYISIAFQKEVGMDALVSHRIEESIIQNRNSAQKQAEIPESLNDNKPLKSIEEVEKDYSKIFPPALNKALEDLDDKTITDPEFLESIRRGEGFDTSNLGAIKDFVKGKKHISAKHVIIAMRQSCSEYIKLAKTSEQKSAIVEFQEKSEVAAMYQFLIEAGKEAEAEECLKESRYSKEEIENYNKTFNGKLAEFHALLQTYSKNGNFKKEDFEQAAADLGIDLNKVKEEIKMDPKEFAELFDEIREDSNSIAVGIIRFKSLSKINMLYLKGYIDDETREQFEKDLDEIAENLSGNTHFTDDYLKGLLKKIDESNERLDKINSLEMNFTFYHMKSFDVISYGYVTEKLKNSSEEAIYYSIYGELEDRYLSPILKLDKAGDVTKSSQMRRAIQNIGTYKFRNIEYLNDLRKNNIIDENEYNRRKSEIDNKYNECISVLDNRESEDFIENLVAINKELEADAFELESTSRKENPEKYVKSFSDCFDKRLYNFNINNDTRKKLCDILSQNKSNFSKMSDEDIKKLILEQTGLDKEDKQYKQLKFFLSGKFNKEFYGILRDDKINQKFIENLDKQNKKNDEYKKENIINNHNINKSIRNLLWNMDKAGIDKNNQMLALKNYMELVSYIGSGLNFEEVDSDKFLEMMKNARLIDRRATNEYNSKTYGKVNAEEIDKALDIILSFDFNGNLKNLATDRQAFEERVETILQERIDIIPNDKNIYVSEVSSELFLNQIDFYKEKLKNNEELTKEEKEELSKKIDGFIGGLIKEHRTSSIESEAKDLIKDLKDFKTDSLSANGTLTYVDMDAFRRIFSERTDRINQEFIHQNEMLKLQNPLVYEKVKEFREKGLSERDIYNSLILQQRRDGTIINGLFYSISEDTRKINEGYENGQNLSKVIENKRKIVQLFEDRNILQIEYEDYLTNCPPKLKPGTQEYEEKLNRALNKFDHLMENLDKNGWRFHKVELDEYGEPCKDKHTGEYIYTDELEVDEKSLTDDQKKETYTAVAELYDVLNKERANIIQERINGGHYNIFEFCSRNNNELGNLHKDIPGLKDKVLFYKKMEQAIKSVSKNEVERLKAQIKEEIGYDKNKNKVARDQELNDELAIRLEERMRSELIKLGVSKDNIDRYIGDEHGQKGDTFGGLANAHTFGRLVANEGYRKALIKDLQTQQKKFTDRQTYFDNVEPQAKKMAEEIIRKSFDSFTPALKKGEKEKINYVYSKLIAGFNIGILNGDKNKYDNVELFRKYLSEKKIPREIYIEDRSKIELSTREQEAFDKIIEKIVDRKETGNLSIIYEYLYSNKQSDLIKIFDEEIVGKAGKISDHDFRGLLSKISEPLHIVDKIQDSVFENMQQKKGKELRFDQKFLRAIFGKKDGKAEESDSTGSGDADQAGKKDSDKEGQTTQLIVGGKQPHFSIKDMLHIIKDKSVRMKNVEEEANKTASDVKKAEDQQNGKEEQQNESGPGIE